MGGCLGAVIIAWTVVRLFSVTAAVVISVAVGLVPPVAAIVANAGDESSRRQPGDDGRPARLPAPATAVPAPAASRQRAARGPHVLACWAVATNGPNPPLAPDERASAAGEREMLETFLDLYREIIARKVTGVPAEELRRQLVPSATTLAGLISHLTVVEQEWFQLTLAQRTAADIGGRPRTAAGPWTRARPPTA